VPYSLVQENTKQRNMTNQSKKTVIEPRSRDADRSQLAILAAARDEFSRYGLAGARVDRIAENAKLNKRLIYYYFTSKDDLFLAVLEGTYADIRQAEQQLHLSQERLGQLPVMDRNPDPHGCDDRMLRPEPFGPDLECARQRRLVIDQALEISAVDQLDRAGSVSFHPVGLRAENKAALALLGEFPGRHKRQVLDVPGSRVPLRPYRGHSIKEAANERPIGAIVEREPRGPARPRDRPEPLTRGPPT